MLAPSTRRSALISLSEIGLSEVWSTYQINCFLYVQVNCIKKVSFLIIFSDLQSQSFRVQLLPSEILERNLAGLELLEDYQQLY